MRSQELALALQPLRANPISKGTRVLSLLSKPTRTQLAQQRTLALRDQAASPVAATTSIWLTSRTKATCLGMTSPS